MEVYIYVDGWQDCNTVCGDAVSCETLSGRALAPFLVVYLGGRHALPWTGSFQTAWFTERGSSDVKPCLRLCTATDRYT
jgi:hypothetical protein